MNYKKGQIIFINWDNFYVKLIRFYNRMKYGESGFGHVGIITKVTKDSVQIHEAVSKGFVKSYYPKEFLNGKIGEGTIEVKETKIKLKDVEKNADKYLGRPYGWGDFIGIILSLITGCRFIKITGASRLICSEATARILYDSSNKKINISEELDKTYDLLTPQDIYLSKFLK